MSCSPPLLVRAEKALSLERAGGGVVEEWSFSLRTDSQRLPPIHFRNPSHSQSPIARWLSWQPRDSQELVDLITPQVVLQVSHLITLPI